MRWLASVVILAGLAVVAVVAGSSPAVAHTELLQAAPGPGQRAGGEIDFVDLAFLEPVTEAEVEVALDGVVMPGSMVETDGTIIRHQLDEPLSTPGRYDVTYRMVSFDLDETEEAFWFTFEPEAPTATRIGDPNAGSGRNWVQIIAGIVLIGALIGLAFLFLARLEQNRRLARADTDESGGG